MYPPHPDPMMMTRGLVCSCAVVAVDGVDCDRITWDDVK